MKSSIVLLCVFLSVPVNPARAQPPAKDPAAKLESLMEERRDVLQKAVEILTAQYRVGTVDFRRLSLALNRLGTAKLELAKNQDERIAACQKQIESRRDIEKICQARLKAGTVTEADVLDASAERMTAEIRLLREKAGDNQAQVESLMKERQDVMQKLVQDLDAQYRAESVDFNRWSLTVNRLAEAELESAKNKEERMAACRKQVERRRNVEKICAARPDRGAVTDDDDVESRAERLTAEIQLSREKAADNRAEVELLLKDRQDMIQNLVEILTAQWRVGTIESDRLSHAIDQLCDAELELAKNRDERLEACRKQVGLCRDVEDDCRKGTCRMNPDLDIAETTAERLKAEIRLVREQSAGDAGK